MLNKKRMNRAKKLVRMLFEMSNATNARCHIRALFQSKMIDIVESSSLHEYLNLLEKREEALIGK